METRPLGRTGLSVTPVCVGTSPLGSFPSQYGYEVSTEQALATLRRVLEGPITFIDTSNNYFDAERRIGLALKEAGGLPPGFVLQTKADPAHDSDDFSGARVRDSVHESLERLGLDRLQVLHLHDPERLTFEEATGPGGPVEAMVQLRDEGVVENLGVAGGPIDLMLRYLELDLFQAIISHNRYTLVDQSALPLIEDADERGVAFINGAPYGGGMLVRGPDVEPNYCYQPARPETLDRVRAMLRACEAHGVPLAAAALQFSLREPRIASTMVGMSRPERIDQTLELARWPIPDDLWDDLVPLAAVGRTGVI
ncbi:aldo/keto reductase [Georgenia sp. SYP-B2076]|uniref:aldo/keto reductase n=1 Tax=Georgenia sp. SYP-B2076 TaxID=2495881 RepID=UPI000F8C547B|nr:aldo/keto reductase [Georgenia sp. SYP-B2076]